MANEPKLSLPSMILGRVRWLIELIGGRKVMLGLAVVSLAFTGIIHVTLPRYGAAAVSFLAEEAGMDIEVGDWTPSLGDLKLTAHDVEIRVRGPFARREVLEIESATFDLSLMWRFVHEKGWIRAVHIEEPSLYLERQASGSWNWHRLIDPKYIGELRTAVAAPGRVLPPDSLPAVSASYPSPDGPKSPERWVALALESLEIEDLEILWVEELEGRSGGGVVRRSQAELNIDDVQFFARDVLAPVDDRGPSSRFSIEARVADGLLSVSGSGNFFAWLAPGNGFQRVAGGPGVNPGDGEEVTQWSPIVSMDIYLENVGASAFSAITPDSAIQPMAGSISGHIEATLDRPELIEGAYHRNLRCAAELDLKGVQYASGLDSSSRRGRRLAEQLSDIQGDGPVQFDCGGDLSKETYRPVQAIVTASTRQAMAEAPRDVQRLVVEDQQRYDEEVEVPKALQEIERVTDTINRLDESLQRLPNAPTRAPSRFPFNPFR